MRAIEIINTSLQLTDRPKPKPAEKEVLIKVCAAGINRPDIMQRQGLYPPPQGASDIPGLEISGVVSDIGNAVSTIKKNDQVCALVTGGGYADYCLATADLCLPIPKHFDYIQAAALPETFFTVWSNLFNRAHLQKNETVLIHGGSSGIGTTAIQLAKLSDATVIITAGTDKKCHFCKALGADYAINYNSLNFSNEVNHLTKNLGVNVILDIIGGAYLPENLKCLAEDGRLIQIAIQNGAKTEINLLPIMLKRLTITGSTLRARNDSFKTAIAKQLLSQVWPHLNKGTIQPIIDKTFPLHQAEQAHQLMESSQHMGKIILTL